MIGKLHPMSLAEPGKLHPMNLKDKGMAAMAGGAEGIAKNLHEHGPTPGGQKMMDMEQEAAEHAIATDMYICWRSERTGNKT